MSENNNWPYPDDYVVIECAECGQGHATAKWVVTGDDMCFCFECGNPHEVDDIVEESPYLD